MNKTFFAAVLSIVLFSTVSAFAQSKTFSEADAIAVSDKLEMYCNPDMPKYVEKIAFKFRYDYEDAKSPERTANYFAVTCVAGAYNESSVLLRASDESETLHPVSFAVPRINGAGKLVGFTADVVTGSLTYDAAAKTLSIFSKGRGIGDLYVAGTYELHENEVILRSYTIDNIEGDDMEVPPIYENKEPLE